MRQNEAHPLRQPPFFAAFLNGWPQEGHATAFLLADPPHSGHFISFPIEVSCLRTDDQIGFVERCWGEVPHRASWASFSVNHLVSLWMAASKERSGSLGGLDRFDLAKGLMGEADVGSTQGVPIKSEACLLTLFGQRGNSTIRGIMRHLHRHPSTSSFDAQNVLAGLNLAAVRRGAGEVASGGRIG